MENITMESLQAVDGDDDLFVIIVEGEGNAQDSNHSHQVMKVKEEVIETDESSQETSDELTQLEDWQQNDNISQLIPLYNFKEGSEDNQLLGVEFAGGDSDKEFVPDLNVEEYLDEEGETEALLEQDHRLSAADEEVHRYKMRGPDEQQSFVKDLCEQYPELATDNDSLIETLCDLMIQTKPPDPPPDFYIMNDVNFECATCGALKDSLPAIGRHWQEKHGPRYLTCYACGVDFRSTTNLYKHEKRCRAEDAVTVLKARARFVGRKGRGRPFLPPKEMIPIKRKTEKHKGRFCCKLCPGEYLTKQALQSHELAHLGLRPYQCSQCTQAYTSQTALYRHVRSKHTEQQFICDTCSKNFSSKGALVTHFATHEPLRKFPCELCDRRFAQKMALQLHIDRVHYNLPPPCACKICPKRYPRMSLLKSHMLRAHGMNLITRQMFYKTLPKLSQRQLQLATVVMKSERAVEERPDYYVLNIKPETSLPDETLPDSLQNIAANDMPQVDYDNESTEITNNENTENIDEDFFDCVKKLGDREMSDKTVILIQDGQVIYIDESNKHLYKEQLVHLNHENSEFDNKEAIQQEIHHRLGVSYDTESLDLEVQMNGSQRIQVKGVLVQEISR